MKAKLLQIAGVKTEKEFYKKFPSEEAFMKVHGKEFKKAKIGMKVQGSAPSTNSKMINYQDLYNDNYEQVTGIDPIEQAKQQAAAQAASSSKGSGMGGMDMSSIMSMFSGEGREAEGLASLAGGAKYGRNIPKAQGGIDASVDTGLGTYYPQQQGMIQGPMNAPSNDYYQNNNPYFASNPGPVSLNNPAVATPQTQKSPFDITKGIPVVGGLISGIQALGAQKEARRAAKQAFKVSELNLAASATRPERIQNTYNTPFDNMIQNNQVFPTYGVGTNALSRNGSSIPRAVDGAQVQNTYAPNYTLYDDLGYAPLSGDTKQYYYGGDISKAAFGANFGQNSFGNMAGSVFDNNGGSQIGGAVGSAFGPKGKIVGSLVGGAVDHAFGDGRATKRYMKGFERNMQGMAMNNMAPGIQAPYSSNLKDGGNLTNPQLIAKFGELDSQDFYDYSQEGMNTLRAGGNLSSYTAPSERSLKTYKDGGEVSTSALNGAVKTTWGGGVRTTSVNPYLPETGEIIEFVGNSHDDYDPKSGQTGIGVKYGQENKNSYTDYAEYGTRKAKANVEVEKEPAAQLIDPVTGLPNLTVFGNLLDEDYNRKYKHIVTDISKNQKKLNKLLNKTTIELAEVKNDKLRSNTLEKIIEGVEMSSKKNADEIYDLSFKQSAINDTAKEFGIQADALAKGKVKEDKEAMKEYAEYGKSIKKAEDGLTEDGGKKITKAERDAKIKSGEYRVNPNNPNEIIRVTTKSGTKKEKKSANALGYIPKGQSVDPVTGLSTKITQKEFEDFKAKNSWYDFSKFDPKDPNSVNNMAEKFNEKAKAIGSDARIMPDKDGKVTIVGQQYISATLDEAKEETPASSESDVLTVEDDKRYAVTPYKRSLLMDIANQALPFFRPTNQDALDPQQLYGEMFALSNNQLEPVQAQSFQPQLLTPYDISYQDQLNANQADFNAIQRQAAYNPAALAALSAQKYQANEKVLGEQFRQNQGMRDRVFSGNVNTLNDAKLKNIAMYDQQYTRQEQARSNTKAVAQAALQSISDKYTQNKAENRQSAIAQNMYNYRFDSQGRAINMNPLFQPNMGTVYNKQTNPNMLPVYDAEGNQTGFAPSLATPGIGDGRTTQPARFGKAIKKYAKNGSIVKSYKNL